MRRQTATAGVRLFHLAAQVRSPRALLIFAAAVVVCLTLAAIDGLTAQLGPSGPWRIGYGIAAAAMLVSVFAYSMRRRSPRRGPGRASSWLQFHTYGGAFFLLLVLTHSGFRLPHGILAWAMWTLSLWIVASGLLGLLVQRWIPRLLTSGLSTEANYERIPELVEAIRQEAESLAQAAGGSIQHHYAASLSPLMARPRTRPIFFMDITGGIQPTLRQLEHLGGFLESGDKRVLDRLTALFKTKTELDAHYTLQKALRWWLFLHVPLSLILIVLVGFHIAAVLYY